MGQLNRKLLASGPVARWLRGGLFALILPAVWAVGCKRQPPEVASSASSVPVVHVVRPELRNLICTVDQPGFVEAYEQTAMYSKVSGFIKHYYVDIGQRVKQGDPVADIFVPELDEDHQQKAAQVELDRKMVQQAQQLIVVAQSKVQMAIAQLAEAKANVGKFQADIVRWESELGRLTKMVQERVVDREVLDETRKQFSSSRAARDAALATVAAREADQASAQADLGKAQIDVETARAQVLVAEADERRTAALLAYTKVTAPYDGVITARNANTGDYVQAATGDKSASGGAPMFVIARDDLVRIFVDVPEAYAHYVHEGTKANVRADALSGLEIKATVTRTSWSLAEKTRTLWVEIDLPTKDNDGLRPGMYVYTTVIIQRSKVPMLPQDALQVSGNQTYCFLLQQGKAVKTEVVRGLRDGPWVEVTKLKIPPPDALAASGKPTYREVLQDGTAVKADVVRGLHDGAWVDAAKTKIDDPWVRVSGGENVIVGDLNELTDGQAVETAQDKMQSHQDL
jgi:multidrug efflux pump subunit AcrA (membrane-fusion protein)